MKKQIDAQAPYKTTPPVTLCTYTTLTNKNTAQCLLQKHQIDLVTLHFGNLEHPQKLFPAFLPRLAVRITIGF